MSCVVWGCESHSSRKENSQELLTYYRFPVENDQKKEWINRIGSRKWIPKKHSHICSKHFTLDSFVCATNLKWRRLRENATLTFDEMVYVMFLQNVTSVIQNNLDFFDVLMEDLAVTLSLFPLLGIITMSFVENPMLYHHVMDRQGLLADLYKAVEALDMSAAVFSALNVMRKTRTLPPILNNEKNSDRSCIYRIEGNTLFTSQRYQKAMEWYNKALLYAPKGSIEMLHAYGNRSALLLKLTAYSASLNDIETCFKLGCSGDLLNKLNKRKEDCEKLLWKEHIKNSILKSSFTDNFFKLQGKRHPEVSCLSADVDIIGEPGERKAVAAKDIRVGTLIGLETAFTTYSSNDKSYFTCYYCQKMTFNLMPCENCCFALFCSEKCKDSCVSEYHEIECQIMNVLETIDVGFQFRLSVKTVLKLKTQCKLWNILIKESKNIGSNRMGTSPINQLYDVKNYSSMFSFKERHFIHGIMYNSSFVHATVIHHLEKISGFFPKSPVDCLEAQKCVANLLMTLELLWPCTTEVDNSGEDLAIGEIVTDVPNHYGWFPFTGKLNHSCEPNVIVLGLNNQVGLVAIQPIKKKTELTISFIGHWYEHLYEEQRIMKVFQSTQIACKCRVCVRGWGIHNFDKVNFSHLQMKAYRAWDYMRENMVLPQRDSAFFKETCKTLALFANQPNTKEHYELYRELRTQLSLCQYAQSFNTMINQ